MGYALLREKAPLGQKVEDLGLHLENVLLSDCCVRGKSAANDECASGAVLPGQYFDEETNLHYNHFRYYDPELGRYITSDPIGLLAGLNTYSYANQNSVRFYDPDGKIIVNPWTILKSIEYADCMARCLRGNLPKICGGEESPSGIAACAALCAVKTFVPGKKYAKKIKLFYRYARRAYNRNRNR